MPRGPKPKPKKTMKTQFKEFKPLKMEEYQDMVLPEEEMIMPNSDFDFKDDNGNILKGFSQIDLDKLNQKLKILIIVFCIGLLFFMSVILWILWQLKHYKIITHLIQAL